MNQNEIYATQLATIRTYAPDPDLPANLDLTTISRLGEWSQIFSVLFSRLDRVSTYVYLLLSVFMDFMLYYLFSRYRLLKLRQPNQAIITQTSVAHLGAGDT
jgi:hypothetical protein